MSEIRRDPTTGQWVIIAPERGRRPNADDARAHLATSPGQPYDPACPFCPGNEELLPGIVDEMSCDEAPGWLVRVVPNKYHALDSGIEPKSGNGGERETLPGYGFHEVIIESPRHDADVAHLSASQLAAVMAIYRARYVDLIARPRIEAVMVFRNHGPAGGASLRHPHSQLIATPVIPPRLTEMASWAEAQYGKNGKCVTCAQIARELHDGERVVEATDRFVAFVPFAATSPFEVWILPLGHQASFADSEEEQIAEFAALLGGVLRRIDKALGNPPFTYAIQSAPSRHAAAPYFHWRLRIAPAVVVSGGFEIGGGLPINPSSPEDDAGALRSAEPNS